jgi:hypothetical protein
MQSKVSDMMPLEVQVLQNTGDNSNNNNYYYSSWRFVFCFVFFESKESLKMVI